MTKPAGAVRMVTLAVERPGGLAAVTATPARVLQRDDIGRIAPGVHADLVVLDTSTRVQRVMRRGTWLDPAPAQR